MARTTLNLDQPVLDELRELRVRERKPLGRLASELLTEALARRRSDVREPVGLVWISQPMQARVPLEDKEALYAILDRPAPDEL
ncbi:MAG: hypothetical protein ACRD0X_06260 [Thermoanaerobaculia bacterium]